MHRRHPITGEAILFAPERASRRGAFIASASSNARCPFCPDHESDTPPEIARIGDQKRWEARVFPNRYPAARGAEVIVESADHDARFESIEHPGEIVRLYIDRYRAHSAAPYTALFKNEGSEAGSSIPHLHSQLVPLPFVPPRVAREIEGFANGCPLCAQQDFVIAETESWRWLAPHGSWMAYQQSIVPKRHVAAMTGLHEEEIRELGLLLQRSSRATSAIAPAFNWTFMSFAGHPEAHCYVDVLPRMTTIAGLELGTGTFVEIIDPAAAAERLRT
jgi:UDPglucose--hexose-1-phosphate uridylyltransferase